jgi:hypothetical protein
MLKGSATHRCQASADVADAQHADRAPIQFPADIGAAVDRPPCAGMGASREDALSARVQVRAWDGRSPGN